MKNFERYPVGYGPCAKNHPSDEKSGAPDRNQHLLVTGSDS